MNAEQLWETTLNPDARVMLQVRLDDAVQTDRFSPSSWATRSSRGGSSSRTTR